MELKGLYVITDPELTPENTLLKKVSEAISGGASIVQLRDKTKTDQELYEIARRLCLLCSESGVLFIINDRAELAQKVRAHGVHLGKEDLPLAEAREIMPEAIIGVSCYNDLETAREMEKKGADYVAFGSVFPSPTKPDAVTAPLSLLQAARRQLKIPICAIGGLTPENSEHAVKAGAHMVAVISALWSAPDIRKQAARFARHFRQPDK
ncbi:MAG: thiamine phosphate synthase [Thermodesulfatator sp.]|nr:MAG: thiamine phosphate synthase [Thermodesulfatator sp.]